ncbi:MAG TPA: outer membrane protein assembly factor BamD [Thermoanaerobaculia bacterium]|nr:outer membrane protein assembly factor BamD [Thermoanaerobaculia bacterium]
MNRSKTLPVALLALLALTIPACHHGNRQQVVRVNPEFVSLSKEQVFQRGEEWFAKRKWAKARTYYQHVYETYPNDPLGRRALLRVADTYYMQGDAVNLVEAQYKYRDFTNRYPGSDRADYAMLQIAMVSYKQMEKPDRDTAKTREAIEKFDDMIRAYPKSPLRAEAEARRQDVLNRLAKHEHLIARYYMRRGSWNAAVLRLNGLIDQYGQYNERDAAFYDLATCLQHMGRKGEARLYYERVVTEFPKSDYASRAKKSLASKS